jgi:hypothetical protein
MRKPIIAGNWKMNKTIAEAISFVNDVKNRVENKNVDVVICAPFIALKDLVEATKGNCDETYKKKLVALQNGRRIRRLYHKPYSGMRSWMQVSVLCNVYGKTFR